MGKSTPALPKQVVWKVENVVAKGTTIVNTSQSSLLSKDPVESTIKLIYTLAKFAFTIKVCST